MSHEDFKIRKVWEEKTGKWHFSIVDTVEQFVETSNARNYWKVLKNRLKKGDNELVTKCNQLKMMASDGKYYVTDTADSDTLLEIINTIAPDAHGALKSYLKSEIKGARSTGDSFPQEDLFDSSGRIEIDVLEEPSSFVIKAIIAGIPVEKISIIIATKAVTISGQRRVTESNAVRHLCKEIFWGDFNRTIELPEEVDIDKCEAIESHGLLILKLPKIDMNRSQKIKVKSI